LESGGSKSTITSASIGLKFREDASNKNLAPLRNRIRQRIIPFLEKDLGRNIRQSIWRAATIATEEENWIEDQLPNATSVDLSVTKLRDLPIALQRREILKWLRARKITNVGFDVVENVRSLLNHDAPVAKLIFRKIDMFAAARGKFSSGESA